MTNPAGADRRGGADRVGGAVHQLARNGIKCRLIFEKIGARRDAIAGNRDPSRAPSRAFELMGVADDFLRGRPADYRRQYQRRQPAASRMSVLPSLDTRYPFVLGVPQDETERILKEHVRQIGLAWSSATPNWSAWRRYGSRGDGRGCKRTAPPYRGGRGRSGLLGCDGAHSAVREKPSAFPLIGGTYPRAFPAGRYKGSRATSRSTRKRRSGCSADRALTAFFPLPEESLAADRRQLAGRLDGEPSLAQCQALVDAARPRAAYVLADPRRTAVFRIHRRRERPRISARVACVSRSVMGPQDIHSPARAARA